MNSASLFNFAPLLNVALMGLVVALGPISWVWMQSTPKGPEQGFANTLDEALAKDLLKQRRLLLLSQITLFLTFDLLIFGSFTRLTDSGLGCPDWPGCYGFTSPSGASSMIEGAQQLMPTGPVTHTKAWIEMIHRYLATGVGVLILTITVYAWFNQLSKRLRLSSMLILVWVCVQGAFGAFTVTMKLYPAIVTLHLLGAVILLCLLTGFVFAQAAHLKQRLGGGGAKSMSAALSEAQILEPDSLTRLTQYLGDVSTPEVPGYLSWVMGAAVLVLICQILLGGWVSTNYAVTACTSFPMCQGSWWPAMNFSDGFEIWRGLGVNSAGEILGFEAITAIHYTHRLFAYVVLTGLVWLGWLLRRRERFSKLGGLIWVLTGLQALTGISNAVLQWPLLSAVAHTAGAASLVVVSVLGFLMVRHQIKEAAHLEPRTLNSSVSQETRVASSYSKAS
jgi:cytochrome c oxidase assembly protein subunit 15